MNCIKTFLKPYDLDLLKKIEKNANIHQMVPAFLGSNKRSKKDHLHRSGLPEDIFQRLPQENRVFDMA